MYRVVRINDSYSVLSAWPATYLFSPDEYEVYAPSGRRVRCLTALLLTA